MQWLRPMPFGNFATQSRRDFTNIAQRFNAGLGAYGKPSPGGAKGIPVSPPQSAVPDGTGVRCLLGPSVETLGYFQPSLWDAVDETGWSNSRNVLGLGHVRKLGEKFGIAEKELAAAENEVYGARPVRYGCVLAAAQLGAELSHGASNENLPVGTDAGIL